MELAYHLSLLLGSSAHLLGQQSCQGSALRLTTS